MKDIRFLPGKIGRFYRNSFLKKPKSLSGGNNLYYLNDIIPKNKDVRFITEQEFKSNISKWRRYLFGTLPIIYKIKLEDFYDGTGFCTNYRIELASGHLLSGKENDYLCLVLSDIRGDTERPNAIFRKTSYNNFQRAKKLSLDRANHYMGLLGINADIDDLSSKEIIDRKKVDLTYLTVKKTANDCKVVIGSYGFAIGKRYVKLMFEDDSSLELYEGRNFKQGMHPREFTPQMNTVIPTLDYDPANKDAFIKELCSRVDGLNR